jgi:hypothetical protein
MCVASVASRLPTSEKAAKRRVDFNLCETLTLNTVDVVDVAHV